MHATFLDYATVSFKGDLNPAPLHRALPGIGIRDHTRQQDVAACIAGNEVVLLNKLHLTREIIESTPSLRLVALTATGTNNVDLAAARNAASPSATFATTARPRSCSTSSACC